MAIILLNSSAPFKGDQEVLVLLEGAGLYYFLNLDMPTYPVEEMAPGVRHQSTSHLLTKH